MVKYFTEDKKETAYMKRFLYLWICLALVFVPVFSGCGASLPLIGFGAAVAKGVREAVDTDGIIGILRGPFCAMSAGATLALLLGFLASVFFRGRSKKM